MAKLQYVWFWPNGGPEDGLWGPGSTPAEDAFVRTSRRVTERYSEALAAAGIEARRSAIQMFVSAAEDDASAVVVESHLHPAGDEVFRAFVPAGVAQMSASDRARLVLEVVDAAMLRLAQERGWPVEACHRARQHAMEHGLSFRTAGPWKSNPSRKRRVRPVVRIKDDGLGDLAIEVADARTGVPLGFTRSVRSPLNSVQKLKRSTREMRWADDSTLERPSDWQVRTGTDWGKLDAFDIGDLRPWQEASDAASADSPLPVVVRVL